MSEHDATEVMCEILNELKTMNARTFDLSKVIHDLSNGVETLKTAVELRIQESVAAATEPPPEEKWAEKWSDRARRFVESPEAEKLAAKFALTTDKIAAAAGLTTDAVTAGRCKHIGKLLGEAGYSRVTVNGMSDYRKLQNGAT